MANIIIKSDDRKQREAYVAKSYGVNTNDKAAMEHVSCIAERSKEAVEHGRMMGGRKSW